MKSVLSKFFKIIYGDIAIYLYFYMAMFGLIGAGILNFQKDYIAVPDSVQKDFKPYVRNFLRESKKYVLPIEFQERLNHLTVKFGFPSRLNDEHDFVGWCELNTTTIIVEEDTWKTYSEGSRQSLIDHELGHCLLERQHRPFLAQGNNPVSIMFPQVMPSEYYDKNKARLYPELFEYARSNKVRLENQVLNQTWGQPEIKERFPSVAEYLRFIESEMNGDLYQPWEKKPEVISFDTAEVITASPESKSSRQTK